MKVLGFTGNLVDTFDTDYKASVMAAELIENETSPEEIIIIALGARKRAVRRDVSEIIDDAPDFNNKNYTVIRSHKEGIYDMLPQGLFHSAVVPKNATTTQEITESIKRHRTEELNARRFFLPFEAAINDLRVQMALYENRLDKGAHHDELVNIFKRYWDIFRLLDTAQSNIFLQVLPLIHDIRGNYPVVADVMEMILGVPVSVTPRYQQTRREGESNYSTLADARVGVTLTTGNAFFYDGEDEILVKTGPLSNAQLKLFMPGEKDYKLLQQLCDYLLPVHLDIVFSFELLNRDKTTRLADKDNFFNSSLGLSTYL